MTELDTQKPKEERMYPKDMDKKKERIGKIVLGILFILAGA
jgi:hypothetical protein